MATDKSTTRYNHFLVTPRNVGIVMILSAITAVMLALPISPVMNGGVGLLLAMRPPIPSYAPPINIVKRIPAGRGELMIYRGVQGQTVTRWVAL